MTVRFRAIFASRGKIYEERKPSYDLEIPKTVGDDRCRPARSRHPAICLLKITRLKEQPASVKNGEASLHLVRMIFHVRNDFEVLAFQHNDLHIDPHLKRS